MVLETCRQLVIAWLPSLPLPVALASVAVIGYLVGRMNRDRHETVAQRAKREVQRAQSVALEMEQIAKAVSRHLERHHASLARFKDRVKDLSASEQQETWKRLCEEAEEMLRPTLQLTNEFANAYDRLRQQTNQLMTFTDVRTDALTGVRNRRALDEMLGSILAMKNRYEQVFSLVILDIDHFKRVNDQHGHLTGDKVLRSVAVAISNAARETDFVARYGGEEFVVVMPQTDLAAASIFCERLRIAIEESPLMNLRLTVSGGLAQALDGEDSQSLLSRADSALYAAKAAGRNRMFRHNGKMVEPLPAAADPVLVG